MGAGHSGEDEGAFGSVPPLKSTSFRSWSVRRRSVLEAARWQKRQLQSQVFGVVRHAERADSVYSFFRGTRWTQTEDFRQWPLDPPLSDAGLEAVADTSKRISSFAAERGTHIHIVVTSPYCRCIQTAVEICKELGPGTRLLIDRGMGEIFGPQIMGDTEPVCPIRPMEQVMAYCKAQGVKCMHKAIGEWPAWPEDLRSGRKRYANRFLTFLQRATKTRRNFLLVTHGDGVGATLSMMPSQVGKVLQKVEFGGMFLASRKAPKLAGASARPSSSASAGPRRPGPHGVVPVHSDADLEAASESELDSPRLLKALTSFDDEGPVPGSNMGGWTSPHPPAVKEFCPPELPKSSDGWQVTTHDIMIAEKRKSGPQSSVFNRKVSLLAKSSKLSKEQIEKLLGELSEKPFGGTETGLEPLDMARQDLPRGATTTSLSTYMFGASDFGTFSELGDVHSDVGSEAGESRQNTMHSLESLVIDHDPQSPVGKPLGRRLSRPRLGRPPRNSERCNSQKSQNSVASLQADTDWTTLLNKRPLHRETSPVNTTILEDSAHMAQRGERQQAGERERSVTMPMLDQALQADRPHGGQKAAEQPGDRVGFGEENSPTHAAGTLAVGSAPGWRKTSDAETPLQLSLDNSPLMRRRRSGAESGSRASTASTAVPGSDASPSSPPGAAVPAAAPAQPTVDALRGFMKAGHKRSTSNSPSPRTSQSMGSASPRLQASPRSPGAAPPKSAGARGHGDVVLLSPKSSFGSAADSEVLLLSPRSCGSGSDSDLILLRASDGAKLVNAPMGGPGNHALLTKRPSKLEHGGAPAAPAPLKADFGNSRLMARRLKQEANSASGALPSAPTTPLAGSLKAS